MLLGFSVFNFNSSEIFILIPPWIVSLALSTTSINLYLDDLVLIRVKHVHNRNQADPHRDEGKAP